MNINPEPEDHQKNTLISLPLHSPVDNSYKNPLIISKGSTEHNSNKGFKATHSYSEHLQGLPALDFSEDIDKEKPALLNLPKATNEIDMGEPGSFSAGMGLVDEKKRKEIKEIASINANSTTLKNDFFCCQRKKKPNLREAEAINSTNKDDGISPMSISTELTSSDQNNLRKGLIRQLEIANTLVKLKQAQSKKQSLPDNSIDTPKINEIPLQLKFSNKEQKNPQLDQNSIFSKSTHSPSHNLFSENAVPYPEVDLEESKEFDSNNGELHIGLSREYLNLKKFYSGCPQNYLDHVLEDPTIFSQYMNNSKISSNFSNSKKYMKKRETLLQRMEEFKQCASVQGKKTLVLDLDETLIETNNIRTKDYDQIIKYEEKRYNHYVTLQLYIKMRPFLKEFLLDMSRLFEIIVYTGGNHNYANPILDYIEKCVSLAKNRKSLYKRVKPKVKTSQSLNPYFKAKSAKLPACNALSKLPKKKRKSRSKMSRSDILLEIPIEEIPKKKEHKSDSDIEAYNMNLEPQKYQGFKFDHRLYVSECLMKIDSNLPIVKSLDLFLDNRKLKDIVIVDNNVANFYLNMKNGLAIIPFESKMQNDQELVRLAAYLEKLHQRTNFGKKIKKDFAKFLLKSENSNE